MPADTVKVSGLLPALQPKPTEAEAPWLVVLYSMGSQSWSVAGVLEQRNADWLKTLATQRRAGDADPTKALERARFFAAGLEQPDALMAQVSYEELATVPYATLRGVAVDLSAPQVRQWTAAPRQPERLPLYYLLAGLTEHADDAAWLQQRSLAVDSSRSPSVMSALLAATIEILGPAGLAWVEKNFLSDAAVPDADVQAAILAMGVQGAAGGRLQPDAIVGVYDHFMQSNPHRAGFVASDLANWGHWEFAPRYAHLLRTGTAQVFASRYAMVLYLMRNPRPQAKALLEGLRADGLI
jgi:hypothetical protein